ncbi:MAG: heavy metal translocating P-type ATPase [Eubacteriales bacterium]
MKYEVICNQPGKLRLRFGKYIFSKEQGYGLSSLLLSCNGVLAAQINPVNGNVLIRYQAPQTGVELCAMLKAMKHCDLPTALPTEEQKNQELEQQFFEKVAMLCITHGLRQAIVPAGPRYAWVCFRAIKFLKLGLNSIIQGKMNVELLDATAIAASLCAGNFSTASSTMFLLKLSDLLLEYSNARAKNALSQSLSIHVKQVWKVVDGTEVSIPMSALSVGDVIRIRQGAMIPVDGSVVDGEAMVNEASMTGEPLAAHKKAEKTVFAGTLMEEGQLDVEVRAFGSQSRIAKIVEMIETGEHTKANIQSKAERMADGIVPISFGLFAATLGLTGNMARALSVLMVDFSCAIKLTTPITVISALKESAQDGVLVKGGKYLELLSKVDTVVFDKTGTLTNAVPKVSKILVTDNNYSQEEVLRIAACLEEHFPHSVAAAIVKEANTKGVIHPENHEKVEYIVAHGIASRCNGTRSIIGSPHFIFDDEGVPYPEEIRDWITAEIGADSAIYLAVDGRLIGVLCVNDPPRDDAAQAIALLRETGISNIQMITGDSEATAKFVSEQLGLNGYHASVLPDGKADLIRQWKEAGHTILMVGDGINDTPALSCADVSLTLAGSSDIAREVADVTVLGDSLTDIVYARKLAMGLMKKISNHYSFIVAFNTALIGCGLLGFLNASQAAWLHNASTVSLAAISTKAILPVKPKEKEVNTHETA